MDLKDFKAGDVIYVSEEQMQWLQDIIENPPEPTNKLKELFSKSNEELLKGCLKQEVNEEKYGN